MSGERVSESVKTDRGREGGTEVGRGREGQRE